MTLTDKINLYVDQYEHCFKLYEEGNYTDVVIQLEQFSTQGNPLTMRLLGVCINDGEGLEKNPTKANELFIEAFAGIETLVNNENPVIQRCMGHCYDFGQGTANNTLKAIEWYSKSAEQGDAVSQCCLGTCYFNGKGVEKDVVKSIELWNKSAEQGYARAQNNLGYCYEIGQGVRKNREKAIEWYKKSAEQGNTKALQNLRNLLGQNVVPPKAKQAKHQSRTVEEIALIKAKKIECIIGFIFLVPAFLGIIAFVFCLFGDRGDFSTLRNLSAHWTADYGYSDYGGGGGMSAAPIYLGILSIVGAYLIKDSLKYFFLDSD